LHRRLDVPAQERSPSGNTKDRIMNIAIDRNCYHATTPEPSSVLRAASARFTWALFATQLYLLAVFVGTSLIAIAVQSWLAGEGAQRPAAIVALLLAGVALSLIAGHSGARWLGGVDRDSTRPVQAELALVAREERRATQPASSLQGTFPNNGALLASHP
jgi:hypothetical protein